MESKGISTIYKDLRYGWRVLLNNPAFTAVAVLALGLGIGANTAIFSVVDAILLRPLPYEDPDRLAIVNENNLSKGWTSFSVAPANYLDWAAQNSVFESMAAFGGQGFNWTGAGEPERIRGARVSASLFGLLGVKPALGRTFRDEEDQPGHDDVVLLSYGLWQLRFGSDPGAVGRGLTLNGRSVTVIGVMPAGFEFPFRSEMWKPMAFTAAEKTNHGGHFLSAIGRLKRGVPVEQARADLNRIARSLGEQYPNTNKGWGTGVTPLHEAVAGNMERPLGVLLGAVALVLLIACANVANLLLARAAGREREVAIRAALGASRWRLVRQMLTESLLLAVAGGALGLLLAAWGTQLLVTLAPAAIPRLRDVAINSRALAFTGGIALLTGVLFGLVPALRTVASGQGSVASGNRVTRRAGAALVVAEVGLALVLLIGAGLLLKSFSRLREVNPGFQARGVLTAAVSLPPSKYAQRQQQVAFFERLVVGLQGVSGAQAVALATSLPLVGDYIFGVTIDGRSVPPSETPSANYAAVSEDYFRALGIPLLRGRSFTAQDREGAPRVAVISEAFAKRFFPNEDPLGKRVHITNGPQAWREIVGVVGDTRQYGLTEAVTVQIYEPYLQRPYPNMSLAVRASGDPLGLAPALRAQVLAVDKDQPVSNIAAFERVVDDSVSQRRFTMLLLGLFATLAVILAAVGIYGVMAYAVAQRTREIGVRMALGAQSGDVLRLIVGRGLALALAGVAAGLAAALALTRLLQSLLFEVSARDPATFAVVAAGLSLVALAASYVPARRATRVDPVVALRYE